MTRNRAFSCVLYMCEKHLINCPSPLSIKFPILTFVCMADNDNVPLPILVLHLPVSLTEMVITRFHCIPRHAPNIRVGDVHDLICL